MIPDGKDRGALQKKLPAEVHREFEEKKTDQRPFGERPSWKVTITLRAGRSCNVSLGLGV